MTFDLCDNANLFAKKVFKTSLIITVCSLSLLNTACGLFSSKQDSSLVPVALSPVEVFIISHNPGASDAVGVINDSEFGENVRIVLEQEFTSASGATCRRASLFSTNGEAEVVIMCKDEKEEWKMVPRVWGQGINKVK